MTCDSPSDMSKLTDLHSKLSHAFDNKDSNELVTAIETVCSQALNRMPLTATLYIHTSFSLFLKPK
jgi:hypothetical protein